MANVTTLTAIVKVATQQSNVVLCRGSIVDITDLRQTPHQDRGTSGSMHAPCMALPGSSYIPTTRLQKMSLRPSNSN